MTEPGENRLQEIARLMHAQHNMFRIRRRWAHLPALTDKIDKAIIECAVREYDLRFPPKSEVTKDDIPPEVWMGPGFNTH